MHEVDFLPLSPDRVRRDLDWLLTAKPLLLAGAFGCKDWLGPKRLNMLQTSLRCALQDAPDSLLATAGIHRRLGRYFEALVVVLIDISPDLSLVAADLPVRDAKRTLGAFDLLLQDESQGKHWHVELACKQYLLNGSHRRASAWWGVNARDRLDIKGRHMARRQLRLGSRPEAISLLENMGIRQLQTAGLMVGRLFWPWAEFSGGQALVKPAVAPGAIPTGWWAGEAEFSSLCKRDCDWYSLPYCYGLSPLIEGDCQRLTRLDWDAMEDAEARPRLVVAMQDGEELDRGWLKPRFLE